MDVWRVAALLLCAGLCWPAAGWTAASPLRCEIIEGVSIATLRLGLPISAAIAITGAPLSQQSIGTQTRYALRAPWAELVADQQVVTRITTRDPGCRTPAGLATGASEAAVRGAYAAAVATVVTPAADGEWLTYPFHGVAFFLRRRRVETIEIFRAESAVGGPPSGAPAAAATLAPAVGPTPAAPRPAAPTASPAAVWSLPALAARVEGTTLVISGTAENRGRPQAVFAEVRAFGASGQLVAEGDNPLFPSPVPTGGTGTFEVRLTVDDVVRRYAVVIRPVGSVTGSVVEGTGEIRDLQAFAPIVSRKIQAMVQAINNPPSRDDFVLLVTNASPVVVSSVTVAAEITATCRMVFPAPRTVQEVRSGTATVVQLRPGDSGRAALTLSPGVCVEFATWSARTRVGEVRVGD